MIALAWKKLDAELTPSQIAALSRENIECGLTFGGFAVFHCPLKEDSEPALRMLKVSSSLRSAIRFPMDVPYYAYLRMVDLGVL